MIVRTQPACVYEVLDRGIHRFVWTAQTPELVDEYLAHIERIYNTQPYNKRLRLLIDVRAAIPPFRYGLYRSKQFFSKYPMQPETRAAYICPSSILITLLDSSLRMLPPGAERRFFLDDQEEDALAWLLAGD